MVLGKIISIEIVPSTLYISFNPITEFLSVHPGWERMSWFQGGSAKMRLLAFLMIVLAVCTHCTEGRPPSMIDKVEQTNTNVTVAQDQQRVDSTTPGGSGTQKAYIDPETGEFTTPPEHEVPATNELIPASAFRSSTEEEIKEKPSPVPGGGMMIDLKGHFHNPLSATIEDNGKTKIEHQASDKME